MPSRRDAIAALAGVPALTAFLSACKGGGKKGPEIQGTIAGGNNDFAHQLRSGTLLDRRPARTLLTDVAILGGGISGLTAAWVLKNRGLTDFRILELESAAGGNARWGENEVSRFPWGAHYVPAPVTRNALLEEILEAAGAIGGRTADGKPVWSENVLIREPEERLFFRGLWYEGLYPRIGASRSDLEELRKFENEMVRMAGLKDARGRRAFAIPFSASSDDAAVTELDRLTMAEWLARSGFKSERLRWFVEYGCRDDFGSSLEETSAWAGIHYFAARQPGHTKDEEPAPFLTWPEGNGRVVEVLLAAVGERLTRSALVFDVEFEEAPNGPARVRYLDGPANEVVEISAKRVIYALPKFTAPFLIAPYRKQKPAHLAAFTYAPWMVANVTLSDRPRSPGFPFAWDNVSYDSKSLGYVVATHQTGVDQGPTVWTYYLTFQGKDPKEARRQLLSATWADLASAVLADLTRGHPGIESLVKRIDIYRWAHAMAVPRPGFLWGEARKKAAEPLGPVHFAHSDLSGLPLIEEAMDRGAAAAEAVASALRTR